MSRIIAMGSKFKRVEAAMRQTLLSYATAMDAINQALASTSATVREKELLNSIKTEWGKSHEQAMNITFKLIDR